MWPLLTQSYWRDEAFSVLLASRPLKEIFSLAVNFDHTPPLFSYFQHFWINWFGDGEIAMRSLSLIFLVLSAVFVYKLSRSRLAALAVIINPLLWEYGHEARHYTFYTFAVLAAIYFYQSKKFSLSIFFWITALWSHNFSWLYFAVFWLIVRDWRLLPAGLIGSFWLLFAQKQVQSLNREMWLEAPQGFWWWRESLKVFFGRWWTGLMVLIGLLIRPNRWTVLALVPPLATYLISLVWTPVYLERYLLPSLACCFIFLGAKKWGRWLLLIYLAAVIPVFIRLNSVSTKPPMRETAAGIAIKIKAGEIIVTQQPINFLENYYYLSRYGLETKLYSYLYPGEDHIPDYVGVELIKLEAEILDLPRGRPFWLVKPEGSVIKYE